MPPEGGRAGERVKGSGSAEWKSQDRPLGREGDGVGDAGVSVRGVRQPLDVWGRAAYSESHTNV